MKMWICVDINTVKFIIILVQLGFFAACLESVEDNFAYQRHHAVYSTFDEYVNRQQTRRVYSSRKACLSTI